MRLTTLYFGALAAAIAALVAAGCGGDKPAPKPTVAPAKRQVQRYVEQVTQIRQSLDNARRAYFHAPPRRAAIRRQTSAVQKAYAIAVGQLDAMEPPKVAAEVHARIRKQWGKRAEQLAQVLAESPFSTGRVDDVMAATDRDDAMLEIYRLLR